MGPDGHPREGRFLPPLPERRRMFAGGRFRIHEPLRAGDAVTCRTELAPTAVKQGRSGEMLFRFSALTCNAHRIHYDEAYATEVEGHAGLVVHGPLLTAAFA